MHEFEAAPSKFLGVPRLHGARMRRHELTDEHLSARGAQVAELIPVQYDAGVAFQRVRWRCNAPSAEHPPNSTPDVTHMTCGEVNVDVPTLEALIQPSPQRRTLRRTAERHVRALTVRGS